MTRRTRLSAGSPPGCGIIAFPVVTFLVLVEALITFIAARALRDFFTSGDFGPGNWIVFFVFVALMVIVLYAVGAMIVTYLRLARHRVWLKGPYLIERHVVLRRRIDLRAARVELIPYTADAELVMTATDPRSGKSIQIPLREDGRNLPSGELTALAEAILDEPGLIRRVVDEQEAAMTVASRLRELAADSTRTP
jgi:hypothetical protein